MSDQICDALNLPRMEDILGSDDKKLDNIIENLNNSTEIIQQVQDDEGTFEHVQEMNEVYEEAMQAHRDLMDLAMNMEAKNAGGVAEPAATFLKIALDASKSKTDTKFKKLRLRLDREKFDLQKNANKREVIDVTEESFEANRNDLLKMLKSKNDK